MKFYVLRYGLLTPIDEYDRLILHCDIIDLACITRLTTRMQSHNHLTVLPYFVH